VGAEARSGAVITRARRFFAPQRGVYR